MIQFLNFLQTRFVKHRDQQKYLKFDIGLILRKEKNSRPSRLLFWNRYLQINLSFSTHTLLKVTAMLPEIVLWNYLLIYQILPFNSKNLSENYLTG